jgi:plastocyanin
MNFWDTVQNGFVTTIQQGQTVEWDWVTGTGFHSTTSGPCIPAPCTPDFTWDSGVHSDPNSYTHTFNLQGTFNYYCQVHGSVMQGVVNVVGPQ